MREFPIQLVFDFIMTMIPCNKCFSSLVQVDQVAYTLKMSQQHFT